MVYCIENPTEEPSGKSVGFFFEIIAYNERGTADDEYIFPVSEETSMLKVVLIPNRIFYHRKF